MDKSPKISFFYLMAWSQYVLVFFLFLFFADRRFSTDLYNSSVVDASTSCDVWPWNMCVSKNDDIALSETFEKEMSEVFVNKNK